MKPRYKTASTPLVVFLFFITVSSYLGALVMRTLAPTPAQSDTQLPPKHAGKSGSPTSSAQLDGVFGNVPLSFEVNKKQTDSSVQFISRGRGYNVFLTSTEAVMAVSGKSNAVRMGLIGSNNQAQATG